MSTGMAPMNPSTFSSHLTVTPKMFLFRRLWSILHSERGGYHVGLRGYNGGPDLTGYSP